MRTLLPIVSVYMFYALVTFGHFYRIQVKKVRPRHYLYALIWPAWWMLAYGVGGTIRMVGETIRVAFRAVFRPLDQYVNVYGFVAFTWLFTAGHYLSRAWPACEGFLGCSAVAVKTMVWMLLFPVYWGWELAT